MKYLGRFFWTVVYLAIPVIGWLALFQSIKRIKAGEISVIKHFSGMVEVIETPGIYFRPFFGDAFGLTHKITDAFIDFGPLKRVFLPVNKKAVKMDSNGQYVELKQGYNLIHADETYEKTWMVDSTSDDYILGNTRHLRIRTGELGESYKNGEFTLLEPGEHILKPTHAFIKRVPANTDLVDLGPLKIVTVKDGQVAIINTTDGVKMKGPGKHSISQENGDNYIETITTSLQGLELAPLVAMCSDQIEMRAKSMVMYTVKEPLKTLGLGLDKILDTLKIYGDGILRSILSRYSSNDISPSLHLDEAHPAAERTAKLKQVHDEFVKSLNEKSKEWGLEVSDLQITEILPADEDFLKTLQGIGTQQVEFEIKKAIANSEADIAQIKAKSEEAKLVAAKNEQKAKIVEAETKAQELAIDTQAQAQREINLAKAKAEALGVMAEAQTRRLSNLSLVLEKADETTRDIAKLEAQGSVNATILERAQNPVFVQPDLGHTTSIKKSAEGGITLFSTNKTPGVDVMALSAMKQVVFNSV